MRLIQYYGTSMAFQIGCHAAFVLFIIGFIIKEARNIKQQKRKYLKEVWNVIEIGK